MIRTVLCVTLVSLGVLTMLIGSIGIVRLPDFFSRTHAASKVDTMGIIIILLGLAAYEGATINGAKLLIAAVMVGLSNPVAAHALARVAMRFGLRPWTRKEQPSQGVE